MHFCWSGNRALIRGVTRPIARDFEISKVGWRGCASISAYPSNCSVCERLKGWTTEDVVSVLDPEQDA
jgi:hypothetical protein